MKLHKASQPMEFQCLVSDFESCFLSVKARVLSNKLKLNDEKKNRSHASRSINLTKTDPIQKGWKSISLNPHVKI